MNAKINSWNLLLLFQRAQKDQRKFSEHSQVQMISYLLIKMFLFRRALEPCLLSPLRNPLRRGVPLVLLRGAPGRTEGKAGEVREVRATRGGIRWEGSGCLGVVRMVMYLVIKKVVLNLWNWVNKKENRFRWRRNGLNNIWNSEDNKKVSFSLRTSQNYIYKWT